MRNADLRARCEMDMARGNDILQRVQSAGNAFTTQLKECSQRLAEIRSRSASHDQSSDEIREHQSSAHGGPSSTVEAVQQVLLRKVLAIDRGQAATVSVLVFVCLRTCAVCAARVSDSVCSILDGVET